MSKSRQPPAQSPPQLRAVSIGFSSGYHWKLNGTDWGVLTWASRGVIRVTVDDAIWAVPPQQALWLPQRRAQRAAWRGALRQVFIAAPICRRLPATPRVIQVSPLLRELLRRVCTVGTLDRRVAEQRRLFDVLLDELVEMPLHPSSSPCRATHAPAAPPTSSAAIRRPHTTPIRWRATPAPARRTLERLFRAETGLSFGAWRQRARLVHAMTLLADGLSVTQVGTAVGYGGTSAFVAAFRRMVGVTPGRYALPAR
ncbi:MAG: helix-turn-helix transcriptional regulator [Gemmatimonadetes bacterium]|nr:helix-turn-helix transcriptional regulator [Gemmatimonadota bacterium]